MAGFAAGVLTLGLLALIFSAYRARELCVLSVRDGRLRITRGTLPQGAVEALADVMSRGKVSHGTVRVLRDGERARLSASGLDEHTLQRARNVIGTYPLARLLAGPRR